MTPANLPASVRARLRNIAERDRVAFNSILTRYGLERMLYRLSVGESRESFLLKGALLFDVWFATPSRPTRDIDLLAFGLSDSERIAEMFHVACSLVVPDGITFDPLTVSTTDIRKEAGYPGIRATMHRSMSRLTSDSAMPSLPDRWLCHSRSCSTTCRHRCLVPIQGQRSSQRSSRPSSGSAG